MDAQEQPVQPDFDPFEEAVRITRHQLHVHYRENRSDEVNKTWSAEVSWIGAGEEEYAVGHDAVAHVFAAIAGNVVKCDITDEHFDVISPAPNVYVCTGVYWVATDPSTGVFIRVHQRITTVFVLEGGQLRCCHLHLSNPYSEMLEGDVGFPHQVAQQTYDYMQEELAKARKQIESQTAELDSIYNTVPCGIMRFKRTSDGFSPLMMNHAVAELIGTTDDELAHMDWSEGFSPTLVEEDARKLQAALRELVEPGDEVDMLVRMRRRNGEIIYVNSCNALISADKDGDIVQKIAFDITDRVMMEKTLERMSYEDGLTGLYNRTKFNRALQESHGQNMRSLGVAYFDINGLKATNDQFGHKAGDDLICRAAGHVNHSFAGRTYRIGGDEFVVIAPDLCRADFEHKVASIMEHMRNDGIKIAVGTSWRDRDCSVMEQFDEADERMYQDKAAFYRAHDRRKS